jgi:hypothetical protein
MLAIPKDITVSVVLVAVFAFVAILGAPTRIMDALIAYPTIVRAGWLLAVLALAFNKYYLSAVLLAVLGLRIAMDARSSYAFSNTGIMNAYAELQKNDPRFAARLGHGKRASASQRAGSANTPSSSGAPPSTAAAAPITVPSLLMPWLLSSATVCRRGPNDSGVSS